MPLDNSPARRSSGHNMRVGVDTMETNIHWLGRNVPTTRILPYSGTSHRVCETRPLRSCHVRPFPHQKTWPRRSSPPCFHLTGKARSLFDQLADFPKQITPPTFGPPH